MRVLISNIPGSARDYVYKALSQIYGSSIEMISLTNENLEYNIRYADADDVLLVVLDTQSFNRCRGVADRVLNSDRCYEYRDDNSLIYFLENQYGVRLDRIDTSWQQPKQNTWEQQSKQNAWEQPTYSPPQDLSYRREEQSYRREEPTYNYQQNYTGGGYNLEPPKSDNFAYRREEPYSPPVDPYYKDTYNPQRVDNYNPRESYVDHSKVYEDLEAKNREVERLTKTSEDYRLKYNTLSKDYDSSKKLIESLNAKIEELNLQSTDRYRVLNEKDKEIQNLKIHLDTLNKELDDKKAQVFSLNETVTHLKNDSTGYVALRSDFQMLQTNYDSLLQNYDELKQKYDNLSIERENIVNTNRKEISSLTEQLRDKEDELQSQLEIVTSLNSELIRLENYKSAVEIASDTNGDSGNVIDEITYLRDKIAGFESDIFVRLSRVSGPTSKINIGVLPKKGVSSELNTLRLVFPGTPNSIRGMYHIVKDQIAVDNRCRHLFVELTTNCFGDYYFGCKNVKSAIPWYEGKANLRDCISKTELPHLEYLSLGKKYINDIFLLNVDWEKRLLELDRYCDKVTLCFGDLSSLVPRYLHQELANFIYSEVYTVGAVLDTRNLITSISGIVNSKESRYRFFEINNKSRDAEKCINYLEKEGYQCIRL